MKATPDNLSEIVLGELSEFVGALPEDFAEAQKKAAKAAVRELKRTSPKGPNGYAESWKSKTKKTRLGGETTIYSEKPGLPHLLEHGHPIVRGGRTVGHARAIPHIAAAEEHAIKDYEDELRRRVENGT